MSHSQYNMGEKMLNIFDCVAGKSNEQLHCGSYEYHFAIVASVEPLVLISADGDMRWSSILTENIEKIDRQSTAFERHTVVNRYNSEHDKKLPSPDITYGDIFTTIIERYMDDNSEEGTFTYYTNVKIAINNNVVDKVKENGDNITIFFNSYPLNVPINKSTVFKGTITVSSLIEQFDIV